MEISKNNEFENSNDKKNIKNKRIIVSKKNKFKQKGNYILENTIGEGAFAKVKLAKHIITGEKVAIKILPKRNISSNSKNSRNNNNISKIKKEINILRRLHHKNIIQLYEIIETKNNLYIVMEYCEGKELFDYIVNRKKLTEREACRYFQQIINGVEYLHLCNITHRDLKPENILLDNKKRIRISDFGLSGITENYGSLLSTPCGTPLYAPPEMLRGDRYDGVFSDIWSCGIILYTMLVGDLPYADSKEKIIYQNIMTHNYYYPETLSDDAVDLIEHMLKINPNERYGFKEIKAHPWFNLVLPKLRPGIIFNIHKIPVDEKILEKIEEMGFDKQKCKKSVLENNYDSYMAIYLLTLKQSIREGIESISDLFSEEYIRYINDYQNWIDTSKINSPLFNEYNVSNIPNNDLNDENINNNIFIDNIELIDSDKMLNDLGNNFDNVSNEEKKEYLNILKKKSNEISEYFNKQNYQENANKKLILTNSITKEKKNFFHNQKASIKSFDSSNFSYPINIEDGTDIKSNDYNLIITINRKISKKKFIKKDKYNNNNNKFKKFKGLASLKTEAKKIQKYPKFNNNALYKKLHVKEILKKRIFTKQNAQIPSPSKNSPNKNKNNDEINNDNESLLSPIIFEKRINYFIDDEDKDKLNKTIKVRKIGKNKKIKSLANNSDLKFSNNIEDNEILDKISNDNLLDLENNSKLILTPSGHLQDNNSDSKTFFSREENTYLSINSANIHKNNTLNASKRKKTINNMKKLKINKFRNNKKEFQSFSKTAKFLGNKNIRKNKKDNLLLLTDPLGTEAKNKLKKEIEDDLNKFDKDLKIIDNISKNKFIKFQNDISVNVNENLGLFNMQNFADKLIKTTIFKNYLIRNNKKVKNDNEIEDKFYILEKYKNAIGLIEKIKNKVFMDKLSDFNFYTFDQYLNDEDDKVISSRLLKNKKFFLFIKKTKETLFNNSNTINKRSYSKNYSFQRNSLFNKNNINLKNRSKTPQCQLNNIINKTQNQFYKYKNNNNFNYNRNSFKASLLRRSIQNQKKNKSILLRNLSPDYIKKRDKLSHSIEIRKNDNLNINRDYYNNYFNSIKNKSVRKRLTFNYNYYLTDNKFNTTQNSITKFNLDNSNSTLNSIIIEEGNDINNYGSSNKNLSVKKCITNDSTIKIIHRKSNILKNNKTLKTENTRKNRRIYFNNIIKDVNIRSNSDKKDLKMNFDIKDIRDRGIEKKNEKKNYMHSTPEGKCKKNYKKTYNYNTIKNNKLKNLKYFDKKNTFNNLNDKKIKEIKNTINNLKTQNKCEIKELKDFYPIDLNCIFFKNYNEIILKIKKYFKLAKYTINEKETSIKIFKNGLNIEINFYSLKDLEVNNAYICFKFKGGNKAKSIEIINNLLIYLHNKE